MESNVRLLTVYKLLIIGDYGVGKTSLMLRFADDTFDSGYIATIGVDFKVRTLKMDGKQVKLQIWDTAGQERFRTITKGFYRGAKGVILVYDITDERSFQSIEKWMKSLQENASADIAKMIIGNKCDLDEERKITREMGEELAKRYNVPFLEASAKISTNIEESFFDLARAIKSNVDRQDSEGSSSQESQGTVAIAEKPTEEETGEQDKKQCCRFL